MVTKTKCEAKHPTLRLSQLEFDKEYHMCSITIPNIINEVWAFKAKEQRDRFAIDLELEYNNIYDKGKVTDYICKARIMRQ